MPRTGLWKDEPADELLAACYRKALLLAEQNRIDAIAFPAISGGAFGYPLEPATRIAVRSVLETLPRFSLVRHIRFVLFSATDEQVYSQVLAESRSRASEPG